MGFVSARSSVLFPIGLARCAILSVLGCGGAPPPDVRARPLPHVEAKALVSVGAPMLPRWELHPPGGAHARAKLDLGGDAVYVTDGGARWLVRGEVAESAPTLLPDALASVTRSTDGPG